jgi:hypothetical protein
MRHREREGSLRIKIALPFVYEHHRKARTPRPYSIRTGMSILQDP